MKQPSRPAWCWAVYEWNGHLDRYEFVAFWLRQTTDQERPVYTFNPREGSRDPPGWSIVFSPLRKNQAAFFVRYPAPEIRNILFHHVDRRFNDTREL